MDWYPWYFTIYKMDTLHLTPYQDGCYRRMIDYYMETRSPIPDNDFAIARICGDSHPNWEAMGGAIAKAFFKSKNGLLYSKRCEQILENQDKTIKKLSESGKKGAEKRWSKINNIDSPPIADPIADPIAKEKEEEDIDSNIDRDSKIDSLSSNHEIQIAFDLYNELAKKIGLATAQVLSGKRKSGIKSRLKDAGGIDGWKIALSKIEESDFLCGKKTDWKADLDFLITKSKFIGIMEGKYQNNKPQSRIENLNNQAKELIENGW